MPLCLGDKESNERAGQWTAWAKGVIMKYLLDIQFFADEDDDFDADILTFDEILNDKIYQAEFDRRVTKAIDTAIEGAKTKWEKEAEAQRSEAERLATLSADERKQVELDKAMQKVAEAEAKLNAYELKETALQIASERKVPASLLEVIDYTKENADTMKAKIDGIERAYKEAVKVGISDALGENPPRHHEDDEPIVTEIPDLW